MTRATLVRWLKRLVIAVVVLIATILFIVLPLGGSFLITNARFQMRERGPQTPSEVGLTVTSVEFYSSDGVSLRGWWTPGQASKAVIIFCHGLNRSRLELMERAAEASRAGYGVLLFDFRGHGQSGTAYRTLGIHEMKDVCAAGQAVRDRAANRPQVLWGVSMGASTALLAAQRCKPFKAVVADSSFLSFRETISHHVKLFFGLPSFPFANLIIGITKMRMGMNPDDGDVEASVRQMNDVPILFIAGTADRRMPPELAERLKRASNNPKSELLIVPDATHGEAYSKNKALYMNAVFAFLDRAL